MFQHNVTFLLDEITAPTTSCQHGSVPTPTLFGGLVESICNKRAGSNESLSNTPRNTYNHFAKTVQTFMTLVERYLHCYGCIR
ncbi:hypothetical protein O9992_19495 [Vibrio lentus]|nr:hypothetical protein [Vibrio lentus]